MDSIEKTLEGNRQHPLIYQRWLFLADKVEKSPILLDIPLQNIRNWIEEGRLGDPWALTAWRDLIESARKSDSDMLNLLQLLRDDGERARQLKSCSPFAGVMTREERDQFTCAWTH